MFLLSYHQTDVIRAISRRLCGIANGVWGFFILSQLALLLQRRRTGLFGRRKNALGKEEENPQEISVGLQL